MDKLQGLWHRRRQYENVPSKNRIHPSTRGPPATIPGNLDDPGSGVHVQIRSQILGDAPGAFDTPISWFAHPVKHTIFRDKSRGPWGGNTSFQPLVDPTPKTRIAGGEILGAVVKDTLAERVILDAARRQPSTNAPPFVQHSNLDARSLQNGGRNQPSQASTYNNTFLVFTTHAIPFLGA
jgi:hypothetical protein